MDFSLVKSFSSSSLKLFSPAKLNLFFRILAKRPDGYHEIASLYQAIDLFDRISLEFSEEDSFSSSATFLEKDPSNSILKALLLFRKKMGASFSVKIHLDKKIPIQAGLGGGSGNAATTLWGLNELCGSPLTVAELSSLGAEIGSDVSFFFSLGSAYCTGRGEKIKNVEMVLPFSAFLAVPSFGMMTSAVYRAVDMTLLPKKNPEDLLKSFGKDSPSYYNDLEKAAFSVDPRLKEIKERLLSMGFDQVVMTGSGSCFFCLGNAKPDGSEDLVFHSIKSCKREEKKWYCST